MNAVQEQAIQQTGADQNYLMECVSRGSHNRKTIESFLVRAYQKAHQAHLQDFLPHHLCLYHGSDVVSCIGVNSANNALFLEQYIDAPIEQLVSLHTARPVSRAQIIEIGNLASIGRFQTTLTFVNLIMVLSQLGYQWLTFTAIQQVQSIIAKFELPTWTLSTANQNKLDPSATKWGAYYDKNPQVMAIRLQDAKDKILQCPKLTFMARQYQCEVNRSAKLLDSEIQSHL